MAKEYLDKTGLTYLWSKLKDTFALKTSLDTTDSTVSTHTSEISSLNSKMSTAEFKRIGIANGGSGALSIPNNGKAFVISSGASATAKGLFIFNASSTGGISYSSEFGADGITVTVSANTATFSNGSGGYALLLALLYS